MRNNRYNCISICSAIVFPYWLQKEQEGTMDNKMWLKALSQLFNTQSQPAHFPRRFWLTPKQRMAILEELLRPVGKCE